MEILNVYKLRLLPLLLLSLLWSCDRKELPAHEELYTGTVLLSLEWPETAPAHPTEHVHVWGIHSSGTSGAIEQDTLFLLDAGATARLSLLEAEYTLAAWHDAGNVSFDGMHFRLDTDEDGLLTEPDAFYACSDKFRVTAGQETDFVIKLSPYTRILAFSFSLDAQDEKRIKDIHATLSGIASTRKLSDRTTDSHQAGSMCWKLEREDTPPTRATQEVRYSGKKRLLGIHTGENQKLSLTLQYTNGEEETLEQDLTPTLQNFNAAGQEDQVFILSATLNIAGQASASASIEDWKEGTEEDLGANGTSNNSIK